MLVHVRRWSIANNESPHGLAIACQVLLFSVGDTKEKKPIRRYRPRHVSPLAIKIQRLCCYIPRSCNSTAHLDVRFGSKADICSAPTHVRFTPNSDRKSGLPQELMSALPPKADMCSALDHVCFGPKADIAQLGS